MDDRKHPTACGACSSSGRLLSYPLSLGPSCWTCRPALAGEKTFVNVRVSSIRMVIDAFRESRVRGGGSLVFRAVLRRGMWDGTGAETTFMSCS